MHVLSKVLTGVALVATASGCAMSPTVRGDYDHQANFAQYRSFAFMQPLGTDQAGYTSILTERLKDATRQQMQARGYVYDAAAPDLLVNFSGKLSEKTDVIPAPPMPPLDPYYGYRDGFYGPWAGYGWGNDVVQYTQGTLNIDLVDPRMRQLVWEGVAVGEVDNLQSAESAASIDAAVAKVFTQYPFRAGSGTPVKAPAR